MPLFSYVRPYSLITSPNKEQLVHNQQLLKLHNIVHFHLVWICFGGLSLLKVFPYFHQYLQIEPNYNADYCCIREPWYVLVTNGWLMSWSMSLDYFPILWLAISIWQLYGIIIGFEWSAIFRTFLVADGTLVIPINAI